MKVSCVMFLFDIKYYEIVRKQKGNIMNIDFEEKKQIAPWKKVLIEILIWIACIGLSIYMAYFVTHYTLEKTNVTDDSMSATLQKDDSILINKFPYIFKGPKRFDVIVFKKENSISDFYNIKRVVGLPGETVTIKDGKIYINDDEITEPINVEPMNNGGLAKDGITLEDNEYFVLGDNRNGSEDSRFATIGIIKKEEIIGKAWIRLNSISIISELNQLE